MHRILPNALTICRLAIALVFLVVLNHYRYGANTDNVLIVSFCLFLIAAGTDWLDGFLARKWHVETTFGRIMDPLCDKVLVLGAFIFLAGPRFVDPTHAQPSDDMLFWAMIPDNTVSGVYPWMVVLMLVRELLVTSVRGEMEGRGIKFGANIWGKLKTTLQVFTIPAVLVIIWLDPFEPGHYWLKTLRTALVYGTVIATLLSGVPYIRGAIASLKQEHTP